MHRAVLFYYVRGLLR